MQQLRECLKQPAYGPAPGAECNENRKSLHVASLARYVTLERTVSAVAAR